MLLKKEKEVFLPLHTLNKVKKTLRTRRLSWARWYVKKHVTGAAKWMELFWLYRADGPYSDQGHILLEKCRCS